MYQLKKKNLLVHKSRLNFLESFKFINEQFVNLKWRRFFIKQFKKKLYYNYYKKGFKNRFFLGYNLIRRNPRFKINKKILFYRFKVFKLFYGFSKLSKIRYFQKFFIKSRNRLRLYSQLFKRLEYRLDVILYRIKFMQNTLISHDFILKGLIYINYKPIYNKYQFVKIFDIISIAPVLQKQIYTNIKFLINYYILQGHTINLYFLFKRYLEVNYNSLECIFIKDPLFEDIISTLPINFKKLDILSVIKKKC